MINRNQNTQDPEKRFILLSAYLDQEITYSEKQLVEQWLAEDCQFRELYRQQLRLKGGLRELPTPQSQAHSEALTEQFVNQVIAKSQKRSRHKLLALMGGASLALVSLVTGIFTLAPNQRPLEFGLANQSVPLKEDSEPLLIALEKPIIPLPKALTGVTSSLQRK